MHREGQLGFRCEHRRQAQPHGGIDLRFHVRHTSGSARIGVSRSPAEVAVDSVSLHPVRDLLDGCLVRPGVRPRNLGSTVARETGVRESVQAGDLGCGVRRDSAAHLVGLQNGDPSARLGEEQRRRQARDARAYHDHVVRRVRLRLRALGRGPGRLVARRRDPQRRIDLRQASHAPVYALRPGAKPSHRASADHGAVPDRLRCGEGRRNA
jgi:hypothetical protein